MTKDYLAQMLGYLTRLNPPATETSAVSHAFIWLFFHVRHCQGVAICILIVILPSMPARAFNTLEANDLDSLPGVYPSRNFKAIGGSRVAVWMEFICSTRGGQRALCMFASELETGSGMV